MTVADNIDAFWLSKLGVERLAELPGGATGRGNVEKALNVVRQTKRDRKVFHDLIYEGFDGYFHQSVFVRTLGGKSLAGPLTQLEVGKTEKDVEWWARQAPRTGPVRVLAGARKQMQFLTDNDDVVRRTVAIPVMAEAAPSQLRVRVLTVQSTAPTWTELLGLPVRRILTPVVDTDLSDQLSLAIAPAPEDLGEMQDLSAKAIELMKSTDNVHTYSGTFAVRTVGHTKHTAAGGRVGRRRQPLHVVMPEEFDELVSSDKIRHCEIEIQKEFKGLAAGTTLVIYPVEGKIVFRRMLGRGLIDDFLAYMAR